MLIYLFILFVILNILKSAWFKGVFGELMVNFILKIKLHKNTYHLIKNATLPTTEGTTQIDHIVVSTYGVFVIETKNMKGWIFGSKNQKQWTQKIYRHTHKFQNPLHQNYKHVKTLENYLDIAPESIFSVVVFIGNSSFKTDMPANVTQSTGCITYIKSKNEEILSCEQVSNIKNIIIQKKLTPSLKTNREHIAHVKKLAESKSSYKTCSKCGSKMVSRTGKRGSNVGNKFWGCSTYPKCWHTESKH